MRAQIGQKVVAELTIRDEHRIHIPALDQVAQETWIIRRPKKTVKKKDIRRQSGKLGQPGVLAAEGGCDGHVPAARAELGEQVEVEFIRPAHGQPRRDQEQTRLLFVESIFPRERVGDGFIRLKPRGLGSGKIVPETRVAPAQFFPKRGLALASVPVPPALAMILTPTIPVEILRQRRAPISLTGAAQPEVPVFQACPIRFVIATDRLMDATTDRAGRVDDILFEKDITVMKALFPQVCLGVKAHRIAFHKREFGIGLQQPDPFLYGGRLQ